MGAVDLRQEQPKREQVLSVLISMCPTSMRQIFTIDQLLTYLRKFLVTEETVVKAEAKAIEVPQGVH